MGSGHRILYDLIGDVIPYEMDDPGDGQALIVDRQFGVFPLVSAAAETRTLAAPTQAGLIIHMMCKTYVGNIVVTIASIYDEAGGTTITFNEAGEFVTLVSVPLSTAYVWRILAFDSVTGPTIEMGALDVDTFNVSGSTTLLHLTTTGATILPTANIATQLSTTLAAEHGAGAISTAIAPKTTRRTVNGTIITEIKFDLTGLACKGGNAGDAIGLASGVLDAYIGRHVVATDGVVYKVELICLEVPAGSGSATLDVDIVTDATGTYGYDEAIGGSTLINNDTLASGATLVTGEVVQNAVPALTGNDYLYLAEGDTAATDGVYTAGMFILRLYGHAVLA